MAQPTVKLGLVAPFEGRYRAVGYEVVYAIRLAVREANARGGVAGRTLELVALDDGGDADMARLQALKLSTDPDLVGVVGHWLDQTTAAAAPAYVKAGLPLLATTASPLPNGAYRLWLANPAAGGAVDPAFKPCPSPCGWLDGAAWLSAEQDQPGAALAGPALWAFQPFAALAGPAAEGVHVVLPAPLPAHSADPAFAERYRAISHGVEPGAYAVLAYDAANFLIAAVEHSAASAGRPTRAGVAGALAQIEVEGLSGRLRFDRDGDWAGAQAWVYVWRAGALVPAR